MMRRVEVLGGMFILRLIAASDVPADQTDPQMDPPIAHRQTLFAAPRTWRDLLNLIQVRARYITHGNFSRRKYLDACYES